MDSRNPRRTRNFVTATLALALATVMIAYVPLSHILKHVVAAEPRYHHFVAQREVGEQVTDRELVLVSPDRLLFPFFDRIRSQFQSDDPDRPAAYIIFSPNFFDDPMSAKVIADFSCALDARGGQDILWGILFEYVNYIDRENGRAIFEVRTHLGHLVVDFQFDEILHEFHNGFFVRGSVLQIVAPTLDGGTHIAFPISSDASCQAPAKG